MEYAINRGETYAYLAHAVIAEITGSRTAPNIARDVNDAMLQGHRAANVVAT